MAKIVILSMYDYCGSGYRLAQSIGLNTHHFVQYYRFVPDGLLFNRPPTVFSMVNGSWTIGQDNLKSLNKTLESCDIIHFKGDDFPEFPVITLPKKPIVISVSGSFFRRGDSVIARPGREISEYVEVTDYRTSMMADLNYPEFDAVFTPHPYDTDNTKYCWKNKKIPLIVHTPTSRPKKGTELLISAVNEINKDKKVVDLKIIENESHEAALEAIKSATIFFDQATQESYGNSTIEAMAFGVPVITHLSELAIKQSNGILDNCPIINGGNKTETIKEAILEILGLDLQGLSLETREFCEKVHSYKSVAKKWDDIYNSLVYIKDTSESF